MTENSFAGFTIFKQTRFKYCNLLIGASTSKPGSGKSELCTIYHFSCHNSKNLGLIDKETAMESASKWLNPYIHLKHKRNLVPCRLSYNEKV